MEYPDEPGYSFVFMKKGHFISIALFLVLTLWQCRSAQPLHTHLRAMDGSVCSLQMQKAENGIVAIFLNTECPISQKYTLPLEQMSKAFPSFAFVGVFTKWEDPKAIEAFAQEYQLTIPLVLDQHNTLVRQLNATVTPEAFVLGNNGEVLYHGAINNWFYALGKARAQATENYLEDALQSAMTGDTSYRRQTEPVGCIIQQ